MISLKTKVKHWTNTYNRDVNTKCYIHKGIFIARYYDSIVSVMPQYPTFHLIRWLNLEKTLLEMNSLMIKEINDRFEL
jgi:uncharacterized membrane protein